MSEEDQGRNESEANVAPGAVATGERQRGLVVVKRPDEPRTEPWSPRSGLAQRVNRYGLEARVILLEPF